MKAYFTVDPRRVVYDKDEYSRIGGMSLIQIEDDGNLFEVVFIDGHDKYNRTHEEVDEILRDFVRKINGGELRERILPD